MKDLKVLIIGETIIDQYVFCEALGKSGKEPVLVVAGFRNSRISWGCTSYCARHLSDFVMIYQF